MKKFNLEKAKAGAPLITRDGRPARFMGEREHPNYPIIAVVIKDYCIEEVYTYTANGRNITTDETENDLFMALTKRKKYVNFYFNSERGEYDFGRIYDTDKEANDNIIKDGISQYIKTVEIEWEE